MTVMFARQREGTKNLDFWLKKEEQINNWKQSIGDRGRKAAVVWVLPTIVNSENQRNHRNRLGLISPLDRSSARGSRGLDRAYESHSPILLSIFFFGIIARSSNFTIRFPPGDELLKRDARTDAVSYRAVYILISREIETRSCCIRRSRGKKFAAGNNRIVAPSLLLGPTFLDSWFHSSQFETTFFNSQRFLRGLDTCAILIVEKNLT